MDAFAATRLALGVAFLAVAAVSDLRTRRVRDPLWIGLGTIGLVLLLIELAASSAPPRRFALVPAAAILFYAVFFGRPILDEDGFHARPARLGAFAAVAFLVGWSAGSAASGDPAEAAAYAQLLTMPLMVLLYQGFYQVGLLHGGADAKAMIALTLLVPIYPEASPFPLLSSDQRIEPAFRLLFPFSLVVLVDAAVLYIGLPLVLLAYNAARGDARLPQALFGIRAPLNRRPRHAWLMERIDEKGERRLVLFPRRGRDPSADLDRLRAAGVARVWVQPKVPMMVPLLIGFVLAFFVGNLLLLVVAR